MTINSTKKPGQSQKPFPSGKADAADKKPAGDQLQKPGDAFVNVGDKGVAGTWAIGSSASAFDSLNNAGPSPAPPASSEPIAPAPPPMSKPVGIPPPATSPVGPMAPPVAPTSGLTGASMPPMVAVQTVESFSLQEISFEAHELNNRIMTDLPQNSESSFLFSVRLLEHLAIYWRDRSSLLKLDDNEEVFVDFAEVLGNTEQLLNDAEAGKVHENLAWMVNDTLFQIVPERFGFYVPELTGSELLLLAAYHDLACALVYYKASHYVDDSFFKDKLLGEAGGLEGGMVSIKKALDRFGSNEIKVPEFITRYAEIIRMKILGEIAKNRKTGGEPPSSNGSSSTGGSSAPTSSGNTPSSPLGASEMRGISLQTPLMGMVQGVMSTVRPSIFTQPTLFLGSARPVGI